MKLAKRRFLVFASYHYDAAGDEWIANPYRRWGWYPYGFNKRPNVRRSRK